ncbi:MAG TPA: hypothetical protein VHV10_17220 [Ktedonobacteraceae bacterium]|jgi:hypothetical protein|nr:hypothetical protein [Ktedonobacteraceae bacterium]
MSTEIIVAFSLTWSAIGFLFIWVLAKQEKLGALVEAVSAMKKEIGDRDSGMVKSLHDFKTEVRTALKNVR